MTWPPFLELADEPAYRAHFETVYCRAPITTFDGIAVRFYHRDFDHLCFESSDQAGSKDVFSDKRAKRLDWIKAALENPNAELFIGWDNKSSSYDPGRRVCVVCGNYVVVIRITDEKKARFLTAFLADSGRTMSLIRSAPKWPR